MSKAFTDEEMIEAIRAGGRKLDLVMEYIYQRSQFRESIMKFILQYKGSREDAEDIFQEGVCRLLMNVRKGQFQGKSSIRTYLTSICKNLWFTTHAKVNRDTKRDQSWRQKEEIETPPDQMFILKERSQVLQNILTQLGEKCKTILGLWALSYSMKEIKKAVGYKSEGMTRKKKHQCFKRLVTMVKDQPHLVRELIDQL